MAARRRFNSLSIGGAWVATASLSVEMPHFRAVAADGRKLFGRKDQIDIVQRASADERKRAGGPHREPAEGFARPGGTHTSRGVGARSSSVPSMSSKSAVSFRGGNNARAAGTVSGDGLFFRWHIFLAIVKSAKS